MPASIKIWFTTDSLPLSVPSFPLNGTQGAVVDFYGVVRGLERDHAISHLEYEAYEEMARRELTRMIRQLEEAHPCHSVSLVHRLGTVPVGEPSIHVRVTAAHRAEAFAMAQKLMDQMKQDAPIWKKAIPKPV